MECGSRFTFDFCDKPACLGCTIETRDDISSPHLPTHGFVKLRSPIVHHREIGRVLRNAKAGLEHANALLEEAENLRGRKSTEKPFEKSQVAKLRGGEKGVLAGREGIVASPRSESEDKVIFLTCLRCEGPVSSKRWLYCIDCPGALLILMIRVC